MSRRSCLRSRHPPCLSPRLECGSALISAVGSRSDLVARGARGRASGEAARLPPGAVRHHAEVLGVQPRRQAQLHPAGHAGSRGGFPLQTRGRSPLSPDPRLPSQAKPKEAQATRDFSEPRKLVLAANDLVTLVEHRWARWDDGLIPVPVVCRLFFGGSPQPGDVRVEGPEPEDPGGGLVSCKPHSATATHYRRGSTTCQLWVRPRAGFCSHPRPSGLFHLHLHPGEGQPASHGTRGHPPRPQLGDAREPG